MSDLYWLNDEQMADVEGGKPKRQKFKRYPIGCIHIDIAEVQTAEGKALLFCGH